LGFALAGSPTGDGSAFGHGGRIVAAQLHGPLGASQLGGAGHRLAQ
jgi:hypothetical protein